MNAACKQPRVLHCGEEYFSHSIFLTLQILKNELKWPAFPLVFVFRSLYKVAIILKFVLLMCRGE